MCHEKPLPELDFADFYRSVILPVAGLNFVLPAGLILQYLELRPANVLYDLSGDFCLGRILPTEHFLLVGADGNDLVKGHFTSGLAFQLLDPDRLARFDAVLLAPTTNYGVHAASRCNCKHPL